MKWLGGLVLTLGLLSVLVGCGEQSGSTGDAGSDGDLKVAVVLDSGGLGDKSFNDSAWRGMERAKEELGASISNVQSKSEADYEKNLRKMAENGMDLVIAVGISQQSALEAVAPEFPDTKFAIVDAGVEGPNVRALLFTEEEGSFLVGYLAGLMSKTGKIGFVGGMDIDLIKKFQYGYSAGAKLANSNIEILPAKYTGDWENVDKAKEAAKILFADGADIVYHAAGRAGLGVIQAAKETNNYAIGVDSDQDGVAEGRVLTSMIKRVDEAVFATIKDVKEGKYSAGSSVYDLKANGVGISDLTFTKDVIGQENLAKVNKVRDQIVAGEIVVPKDEAGYKAFLAAN